MDDDEVPTTTARLLAKFFDRNGYVRRQNTRRLKAEGHQRYKKGDEVRLVASSDTELATIRRLLSQAGFTPGRPFLKGRQIRQPLYGRQVVARFLAIVDAGHGPNSAAAGRRRALPRSGEFAGPKFARRG